MTRYLCISVTFLDPSFHGRGDDGPEWPPSPLRLFQALLAGAHTGCQEATWSESEAAAFRWIEAQEPPAIVAPRADRTAGYTFFVPNNDGDKAPERQERLTGKIAQAHRMRDGDTVYYLWPLRADETPADREHAEVLCHEARHLIALGWGIDQVAGDGRVLSEAEVHALAGRRWRATKPPLPGRPTWRVPVSGTLANLEEAHRSSIARVNGRQYRPPLKPRQFGMVTYADAKALPPRHFAAFELPDRVARRHEDTAKVAAMLRSLACRCAKADLHEFDGGAERYVAGHVAKDERTPRFSYLPLPTIGHEHADGMIRRLIVAEPFGGEGRHARWARDRLEAEALCEEGGKEIGVLLAPWRPASKAMLRRYTGEAKVWCSVTPVILPGLDDGKPAKAEKLLLAALEHAEVPLEAVAELTLRKAPFWPGSLHPRQYFVPAYLARYARWHVRIVFREPVCGPLAIGAGRHVGLGLFAVRDGHD